MNLWHPTTEATTKNPTRERKKTEILIFISTHKQLRGCLKETDEFGKATNEQKKNA